MQRGQAGTQLTRSAKKVRHRVPSEEAGVLKVIKRGRVVSIRLAAGGRSTAALKSVVDDWLVPMLVREFLAQADKEIQANAIIPSIQIGSKEGAATSRIR